jgi:hypothetical protein
MPFNLSGFSDMGDSGLSAPLLAALLDEHARANLPRYDLFWNYYRNPMDPAGPVSGSRAASGRGFRLAQERGLPPRLTGVSGNASYRSLSGDDRAAARREVVIENDIAWRVHAMVDFLFSRPLKLVSAATDPALRARIEAVLDSAWEASGGMGLLQDAGLLGHVYGHVDLIVRAGTDLGASGSLPFVQPGEGASPSADPAIEAARQVRIEIIEPSRGIPIQNQHDYRLLDGYIIHFRRTSDRVDPSTGRRGIVTQTQIISAVRSALYHDDGRGPRLVHEEENAVEPGRVPVVHIQNVSQPFAYAGLSDVEPLIPLQDELNTRLSDRASRVTMQSFKMYLAKGIDGFDKFPVGPGTIWSTDNPDASVTAFGGDGSSPSEDAHIAQVREAIDKISGVPPLATGVVQAKVGNLSSENALRLTLSGLLARTQRKRLLYGRGIEEASRLVLAALDHAGVLSTSQADRAVRVQWGDPLPSGEVESLAAAKAKSELGVEPGQVLAELGYGRADPGVT